MSFVFLKALSSDCVFIQLLFKVIWEIAGTYR